MKPIVPFSSSSEIMSFTALLNPQTSKLSCLFPSTPLSRTTNISQPTFLKFPTNLHLSSSFQSSHSVQNDNVSHEEEEEDFVIGDCVVFEEGVFDDPYVIQNFEPINQNENRTKPRKRDVEIKTENLVPDEWREVQAEINITKKERRKIAQELQFGTRVEKKRKGLVPLRNVNLEEYLAYKEAKSKQLKPLVLDNPTSFKNGVVEKDGKEWEESEMNNGSSSERVKPKDPRWEVYGKGLDDVTEFFKKYKPGDKKSEGPRKLFTQEEKVLLNRRTPDLRVATSAKWLPLHTLAASGEFYLVNVILKHKADINAVDKDGWTALHKAIIGKKQAIMNYLLRESANPFVRDKDGATLMHYAVRTASSQAIKILLLYDVDINLPDNYGWTPLHLAVQARRTDVVRLLLIKGANKTIKNEDGLTPLELCLYHGPDTRTYELLKLLKLFPKPR